MTGSGMTHEERRLLIWCARVLGKEVLTPEHEASKKLIDLSYRVEREAGVQHKAVQRFKRAKAQKEGKLNAGTHAVTLEH